MHEKVQTCRVWTFGHCDLRWQAYIECMDTANIARQINNILILGEIAEIDHAAQRVRVSDDTGFLSAWLPWLERGSKGLVSWTPPTVGEPAMILCPGGDPAKGRVLAGVVDDEKPAAGRSGDEYVIKFPDGAICKYNHQNRALQFSTDGSVSIDAKSITLNADVTVNGTTDINGNHLQHNGTNVGDTHRHDKVAAGIVKTGEPL